MTARYPLTMDQTAMMPPADPAVGPHPFIGRTDRWCELPGCDRPDRNPIHTLPQFVIPGPDKGRLTVDRLYALLETAKAVSRLRQSGGITAAPHSTLGSTALVLLDQALAALGHGRPPSASERAMAAADKLRREDPETYAALAAGGEIDLRNMESCPRCGAHSLVPHEPGCRIGRGTEPDPRLEPARTPDGTTEVLADYQERGS